MTENQLRPNLAEFRDDFPILSREIEGKPLIYLDSAATALKPQQVIDAVCSFYTKYTANVHRAVHLLSEEATEAFEAARVTVARFINADSREIAFVKNATDALNLVAHTLRKRGLVITPLSEHHSNLLPWRNGEVVVLPHNADGTIDLEKGLELIRSCKPALVSFSTISNALGVQLAVEQLTQTAREVGAYVLLDLSQSVGHVPVDVQSMDCDFACFSGHKMLGPSGVGVLYQREGLDVKIEPITVGGEMVHEVHVDGHVERPWPWCLEAGTPNIEGILGLAAACDYLSMVDVEDIASHCQALTTYLKEKLNKMTGIKVVSPMDAEPGSSVSFAVDGVEAHGVSRILSNRYAMMLRSGFHCAQPLHEVCGLPETVRASFHLYSTLDEVEQLLEGLEVVIQMNRS